MEGTNEGIASPVNIFYSYAHEDKDFLTEINKHLSPLRRRGLIREWYDRDIQAGSEWKQEVNIHLETAHIILLLISSDFMHSDYCYGMEMKRALQRHKLEEACIIPIIVRSIDWEDTPIAPLSVLPSGGIPIQKWPDRDEAYSDIAKNIRKVIERDGPRLTKKVHIGKKKELSVQNNEAHKQTDNNKSEASRNTRSNDAQMMQDADQIRKNLDNLANLVGNYDYGTRVQLRSLSHAVSTGSGADIWSAANIYKAIDPDVIVERFRSHQRFVPTAINRLAEFLVFARSLYIPLLLILPTFALINALNIYDRFMTENHTIGPQPFLLSWIRGFGGLIPVWETPKNVLTMELAIGMFIILLTILIPQFANTVNRKKELEAQKLREEVISTLAEASSYLRSTNL